MNFYLASPGKKSLLHQIPLYLEAILDSLVEKKQ
jgi:hypothetical protein